MQKDRKTERRKYSKAKVQKDRTMEGQNDRKTIRQKDRKAERQKDKKDKKSSVLFWFQQNSFLFLFCESFAG
jgi:hypothetical protein